MTFLSPDRLWLLVAVAALVALYVVLHVRGRRRYEVRFTNLALLDTVAPQRPAWRRHLPAAVFVVGLIGMVLAFARPARNERVPRERATIMMAIDTSLSMQADDVTPSRIDAAKQAAESFLGSLPPTINLGLVTFDAAARVEVAPTTDRDVVRRAIERLELNEGTAIGEAIFAALHAIDQAPDAPNGEPVPGRVVVMSDGETTVGRPNALAAQAATDAEVPVSTIAFGTELGEVTVNAETGPTTVSVPVDEAALEDIATATGGKAYTAATEEELADVYRDIGSSVGYITQHREIGTWFVGAAIAALLLTAALSLLWFARLP
jgi:Ca-activated chloride channel family protein